MIVVISRRRIKNHREKVSVISVHLTQKSKSRENATFEAHQREHTTLYNFSRLQSLLNNHQYFLNKYNKSLNCPTQLERCTSQAIAPYEFDKIAILETNKAANHREWHSS